MKIDAQDIIRGDQLAGARLIRQLEEGDPAGIEVLKRLYPHTGTAFIMGITGPPGSGKSTLVNCIISEVRRRKLKIAVVAIDPSSPISGGALLGDRIRMRRHTEDDGVFIRSMATRGHLGGLTKTTREAVLVFDAMGYDVILIETVGVGQDEVEIAQFAHSTAVVSLPGMGDDIQAMKAGLLEIADLLVVNKADTPGADDVVEQLRAMLDMGRRSQDEWLAPVLKTVAIKDRGIVELVDAYWQHRKFLMDSGQFDEHNAKWEFQFFRQLVMEMAADRIFSEIQDSPAHRTLLGDLRNRRIDPFSAAEDLIQGLEYKK
ncbi:MAG: methylmalonyl Co-A mutase-associated GTPase MeaB [Deltaproteobacteria bacterium]|nr:methylmalonyl Co-A mutase-associated GTPase MeaB [Deltaproteobacteria bacterium]